MTNYFDMYKEINPRLAKQMQIDVEQKQTADV